MKRETTIFLACLAVVALLLSFLLSGQYSAQAQPAKPATPAVTTGSLPKKAAVARAVTNWVPANQGTIAWDPSTLADNTPLPATSTIKYQVWMRRNTVTTGEKVGSEIAATQATLTFSQEGYMLVGVQAIRYDNGTVVNTTEISWSDNPAVCANSQTFGFSSFLAVTIPVGLRPVN